MTSIFRRWRRALWRWHRRVGISALAFLAVMALTGIVLNHADGWKLYEVRLPYGLASQLYGNLISESPVSSISVDDNQLYQIGSDLLLNQHLLSIGCDQSVTGMAFVDGLLWVSCAERLIAATESGEIVETLYPQVGAIEAIANCSSELCLESVSGWQRLDLIALETTVVDRSPLAVAIDFTDYEKLPADLHITPKEINLGRLVSDIHSGALFGSVGRAAVDFLGIIILFLSISGCYLWLGNRRK